MDENEIFFVGQKAFIQKGEDVLVMHDPEEGLDYPGGRIQISETDPIESLKREVFEETGLLIEVDKPFGAWIHQFPEGHKLVGKKVFLITYRCDYVSGEVKLSHEHDNYKWVNKENYYTVNDGTSFFEMLKKYFNN